MAVFISPFLYCNLEVTCFHFKVMQLLITASHTLSMLPSANHSSGSLCCMYRQHDRWFLIHTVHNNFAENNYHLWNTHVHTLKFNISTIIHLHKTHNGTIILSKEIARWSVKENDLLGHWFPTDWTLNDLISTQLAGAMSAEEDAVLPPIHTYLTLCLRERGREGRMDT